MAEHTHLWLHIQTINLLYIIDSKYLVQGRDIESFLLINLTSELDLYLESLSTASWMTPLDFFFYHTKHKMFHCKQDCKKEILKCPDCTKL